MRPGWATAGSIYNWVMGVLVFLGGLGTVILFGPLADIVGIGSRELAPFDAGAAAGVSLIESLFIWIIVGGIFNIAIGITRMVCGYGLWVLHNGLRITAIVIHILFGLQLLGAAIGLMVGGWIFASLGPILFFIPEVLFAVMLLLPGTASAFVGRGRPAQSMGSPTALAPAMGGMTPAMQGAFAGGAPLPPTQGSTGAQFTPPQPPAPPTGASSAPSPGSSSSSGYGNVGSGGVAKTELADATPPTLAWVVERNGPRPGREHQLKDEVTIGRDSGRCEIAIDDPKVSSEHARIRIENGQFVLYDLASRNHSYVNDREVQKHVLRDGDKIRLGPNVQLAFMMVGKGQ